MKKRNNKNGYFATLFQIQDYDFFCIMRQKGLCYHAMAEGGTMKTIESLGSYVDTIVGITTNMTVTINKKVPKETDLSKKR